MNIYAYKMSFLITHFLPSRHTAFYPLSKEFPNSEKHTVEPLYNGHLGDRRKWPLWRGGRCREVKTRVNVWLSTLSAFPSSKCVHVMPTSKHQMTSLSLVLQETLAKQQLCTCITLFCTFLCCFCMTTILKCLISQFIEKVNKHQQNFSLFLCLDMQPRNSTPVWFTYIWQCKWVGIMKEHKFTAGLP